MDFEHRDEIFQTMYQFFQDKVNELEEKRISSGKKAVDYKQKIADISIKIESEKYSNGVKLTKNELEKTKLEYRYLKIRYSKSMSDFNKAVKQKKQFLKYIEILEQRKW